MLFVSWLKELTSQRDVLETVRNVYLHGKVCRVATGNNLSGFFLAIVVLQVLFLNLKGHSHEDFADFWSKLG